jgi:valyl-tRNA synthetase
MVPYGDRGGVPVEPWLTDQWYCDAKTLAKPAIEAVEDGRTEFVPKNWENTYFEWMRNIQPWCISRQLWWGHQIPAWYGPDGTIFVAASEETALADAEAHYGKATDLTREDDVLDTWFSSALWPFSTLGWPDAPDMVQRYYPGDVLVTGFDIIFFWVARMMMMGLHFMGEVPFHKVYIHALVRDAKGQKMSKSKGNIIDPLELIDRFGSDSLRFTLISMAAQGRDIKLSEQRVEGYRNFVTKLWNAARYCQMNDCVPVDGFDPNSATLVPNRWIAASVKRTAAAVDRALADYRFNEAASVLYQFAWHSFCDWYLEFTKPVLTGDDVDAAAETRAMTAWALDQILLMLNPLTPFVTEELWRSLSADREAELIATDWPDYDRLTEDETAVAEIEWLLRLIGQVRTVRSEMNVPAGAKIPLQVKDVSAQTQDRLTRHDDLIKRMARLASVETIDGDPPRGSAQSILDEATLVLPLADVIDLDQERQRLQKEIGKLDGEIAKIDKKLTNDQFLAKAPEAVVDEQRERRDESATRRERLAEALARVSA